MAFYFIERAVVNMMAICNLCTKTKLIISIEKSIIIHSLYRVNDIPYVPVTFDIVLAIATLLLDGNPFSFNVNIETLYSLLYNLGMTTSACNSSLKRIAIP